MSRSNVVANTPNLPANFKLHGLMDLKNDKKTNIGIQVVFVLIAALSAGLAILFEFPIKSNWSTGLKTAATISFCFIYMLVHELTHGIFLKLLSGVNPVYFVRLPFLCTGSTAYFNKKSFIIVALAPVVIWGVFLIAMLLLLPTDFFLVVYIVTALNFAGAAGDYLQVFALLKLPLEILIQDNGKETRLYLPENKI